jgi:photosystem II stability/assembly factor-like uncharacterized protein
MIVFGQNDYFARLSISGGIDLGISPSEEIWIATNIGNVFYTKQIGQLWHIGPFGSHDQYHHHLGKEFKKIIFFSEDTLMLSGNLSNGKENDFVYWTGNKGQNWDKVIFGKSSWIEAAYNSITGKAWIGGNSKLIYYTENKGKTWTSFDKLEAKEDLRFSSIHFAKDERTGLFGSCWNKLYKTKDNCQSWKKLPTPYSQGKYKWISKNERHDINKIRIFGKYYIINQDGRVFITKSNQIDWNHLPKIVDFEVSENGDLFTVNNDLSITIYDSNFFKTWQSKKSIANTPREIGVRNNNLFILTLENIYKVNRDTFIISPLLTDEISIPEPYIKLQYEGEEYGFDNRDILRYDLQKKKWFRFMIVDFSISSASLFEGKIVLSDLNLNKQFTFEPIKKSIEEYTFPKGLFTTLELKEVHFENEMFGCFHSDTSIRSYIKKADNFVVKTNSSSSTYLIDAIPEIKVDKIEYLIKLIDDSRLENVTISDLNITENDIKNFKKFVDKVKKQIKKSDFEHHLYSFPGENIDLNFYKSVADSLFTLSKDEINSVFSQAYVDNSTSKDWRRIIFVFQNEKKLMIENFDDMPNYLYTPWIVDFDGLKFRSNSILFGKEIDKLTNGQFFEKLTRDKNYAIFKIADYIYRKKLNEK